MGAPMKTPEEFEREISSPFTDRRYRVELRAQQRANEQYVWNGFRRLFGLPILKTSEEAAAEVRRSFLLHDPCDHAVDEQPGEGEHIDRGEDHPAPKKSPSASLSKASIRSKGAPP